MRTEGINCCTVLSKPLKKQVEKCLISGMSKHLKKKQTKDFPITVLDSFPDWMVSGIRFDV